MPSALHGAGVAVSRGVADRLQRKILDGEMPPGACLPSQRELSQQFGVSRTSLREAISVLETLGLLSVRPGRGVFVTALDARAPPWQFAKRGSERDAYEARLALEVSAAALAARRIGAAGLEQLGQSVRDMRAAFERTDMLGIVAADAAFHDGLMAACGNPLIGIMYRAVRETMVASQRLPLARRTRLAETVAEHEAILAGLGAHDAEAAGSAMRLHIKGAASRYGIEF